MIQMQCFSQAVEQTDTCRSLLSLAPFGQRITHRAPLSKRLINSDSDSTLN